MNRKKMKPTVNAIVPSTDGNPHETGGGGSDIPNGHQDDIPAPKHQNRKEATKKSKATLCTGVPVVDVNGAKPHNEESLPNVLDTPP